MSNCLDESRSCSEVGPCGRLVSEVKIIACHSVAMGDARGSGMEDLCVSLFTCSTDSACMRLRK